MRSPARSSAPSTSGWRYADARWPAFEGCRRDRRRCDRIGRIAGAEHVEGVQPCADDGWIPASDGQHLGRAIRAHDVEDRTVRTADVDHVPGDTLRQVGQFSRRDQRLGDLLQRDQRFGALLEHSIGGLQLGQLARELLISLVQRTLAGGEQPIGAVQLAGLQAGEIIDGYLPGQRQVAERTLAVTACSAARRAPAEPNPAWKKSKAATSPSRPVPLQCTQPAARYTAPPGGRSG